MTEEAREEHPEESKVQVGSNVSECGSHSPETNLREVTRRKVLRGIRKVDGVAYRHDAQVPRVDVSSVAFQLLADGCVECLVGFGEREL